MRGAGEDSVLNCPLVVLIGVREKHSRHSRLRSRSIAVAVVADGLGSDLRRQFADSEVRLAIASDAQNVSHGVDVVQSEVTLGGEGK